MGLVTPARFVAGLIYRVLETWRNAEKEVVGNMGKPMEKLSCQLCEPLTYAIAMPPYCLESIPTPSSSPTSAAWQFITLMQRVSKHAQNNTCPGSRTRCNLSLHICVVVSDLIIRLLWFLRFMVLNSVINITANCTDAILVLDIQLQE